MKRSNLVPMLFVLFVLSAFASSASAEEGVLPPASFTATGGAWTLETLAGERLDFTKGSILEGKFLTETNPDQHATANLHLEGCKASTLLPCNTLGDAKEVVLLKVLLLVCLVNPTTSTFGLLILPLETVHIEIPAANALLLLKGAAIAELEGAGLAGKEFKWKLEGAKGDQTVALKCTINGNAFMHTLEMASDKEVRDEHASIRGKFSITFSQNVQFEDA